MDTLRIIGMTSEQYDQVYLEGHNCRFERKERPATRYFLYAEDVNTGNHCRILLDEDYSNECYSGWTTASFGILEKEAVDTIPELSYVPIVETTLEIDCTAKNFKCDLFYYSHTGGDEYYPSGYVNVDMDKFREVTVPRDLAAPV